MPLLALLVGLGQLGGAPSLLLPLGFDISNSTVAVADAQRQCFSPGVRETQPEDRAWHFGVLCPGRDVAAEPST